MLTSEIKSKFAMQENWKVLRILKQSFRHAVKSASSSTGFPCWGNLRIMRKLRETPLKENKTWQYKIQIYYWVDTQDEGRSYFARGLQILDVNKKWRKGNTKILPGDTPNLLVKHRIRTSFSKRYRINGVSLISHGSVWFVPLSAISSPSNRPRCPQGPCLFRDWLISSRLLTNRMYNSSVLLPLP